MQICWFWAVLQNRDRILCVSGWGRATGAWSSIVVAVRSGSAVRLTLPMWGRVAQLNRE